MAFGWGSANQRKQVEFMVLDGFMIILAAVAVTAVHPGWAFPPLASTVKSRERQKKRKSEREGISGSEEGEVEGGR